MLIHYKMRNCIDIIVYLQNISNVEIFLIWYSVDIYVTMWYSVGIYDSINTYKTYSHTYTYIFIRKRTYTYTGRGGNGTVPNRVVISYHWSYVLKI